MGRQGARKHGGRKNRGEDENQVESKGDGTEKGRKRI